MLCHARLAEPAQLRRRAIQRQVERQHVDARLAEEAEGAALDVLVDELAHAIFRHVARLRDARHLEQRGLRRDVRIEAAAGRGHQIDRDRRRRVLLLQLVDVALDPLDQRLVGRAEIRAAGIGRVVGRGDGLGRIVRDRARSSPTAGRGSTCRSVNSWPISAEPMTLPSCSIRLPCAWYGKSDPGDAGHGERIDEAGDQRQRDDEDDRGADFFQHDVFSSGEVQGGDHEVDGLDADERNDDAAEAVDQQVAPQQRAGADRPIGDALQRQRDQRDDDQRVEDDRRQDRALRASPGS